MKNVKRETIVHATKTKILSIERIESSYKVGSLSIKENLFRNLCKNGCVNYNNKYSCPPHSPTFLKFSKNSKNMSVICFKISLDQYSPLSYYNRIRASNSVLKSKIDRYLLEYKLKGYKVAGSGSCRACKPCAAKTNEKCKKPDRLIFSLESMGVDVNDLVVKCFGFPLEWYSKTNKEPEYTCTVGAILGIE